MTSSTKKLLVFICKLSLGLAFAGFYPVELFFELFLDLLCFEFNKPFSFLALPLLCRSSVAYSGVSYDILAPSS